MVPLLDPPGKTLVVLPSAPLALGADTQHLMVGLLGTPRMGLLDDPEDGHLGYRREEPRNNCFVRVEDLPLDIQDLPLGIQEEQPLGSQPAVEEPPLGSRPAEAEPLDIHLVRVL